MPCSAAYFTIIAFLSSGTLKYGLRFPVAWSAFETSSLTSEIEEDSISLPVLGVTCYISNALHNIITFVVTK